MATESTQDVGITTKRESVEVLDPNGHNLEQGAGAKALSDIFDRVEAGKSIDEAIDDSKSKAPAQKPAEPTPEPKEAPKPEPVVEQPEADKPDTLEQAMDRKDDEINPPAANPDEPSDEELAVLPHDKPKTAKRIKALLSKISEADSIVATTKKEAAEKLKELEDLRKKLTEVKTIDPETEKRVAAQLDELAQYKRRYDLEKDPEVANRFDNRIKSADERIYGMLTKRGAGEALINLIKEEGGWAKFSDSNRVIPLSGGDQKTAAALAEEIISGLPYTEKRSIDAAVTDQIQTKTEKDRFFEEESKKAKDYFAKQEDMTRAQQEEQAKAHNDAKTYVDGFHKDFAEKTDWLQQHEIPATASASEKADLEAQNKLASDVRSAMEKSKQIKTLPEIMDLMKQAMSYHHEAFRASRLEAKVKALEARLEQVKSAGQSTKKGGSLASSGASLTPEVKTKKPQSLEEFLDRRESGDDAAE